MDEFALNLKCIRIANMISGNCDKDETTKKGNLMRF